MLARCLGSRWHQWNPPFIPYDYNRKALESLFSANEWNIIEYKSSTKQISIGRALGWIRNRPYLLPSAACSDASVENAPRRHPRELRPRRSGHCRFPTKVMKVAEDSFLRNSRNHSPSARYQAADTTSASDILLCCSPARGSPHDRRPNRALSSATSSSKCPLAPRTDSMSGTPEFRSTACLPSSSGSTTLRAHGRDERIGVKAYHDAATFWYELVKRMGAGAVP